MTVVVLGATVVVVARPGRRCAAARWVTVTPFTSGAASTRSSRTLATATLISTISTSASRPFSTRSSGVWKRSVLRMRLMLHMESSSPERARGDEVGYFRNTRFSGGR